MRRSQQQASRRRSTTLYRKAALNRRRRRWWKANLIQPLTRERMNSRWTRAKRLAELMARPWVKLPGRTVSRPMRHRKHFRNRRPKMMQETKEQRRLRMFLQETKEVLLAGKRRRQNPMDMAQMLGPALIQPQEMTMEEMLKRWGIPETERTLLLQWAQQMQLTPEQQLQVNQDLAMGTAVMLVTPEGIEVLNPLEMMQTPPT